VGRFERREREPVGTAAEHDRGDQNEHDPDLADEQDAEDLARQVDVPVAEHPDERHDDQGPHVPGDVRPTEARDGHPEQVPDVAVHADLDRRVGQQRQGGRPRTGRTTEPVAHEREEGAGSWQVPGHRRQTHREQQQDHGGRGVERREPDAVAEQHAQRGGTADDGERGGGRDDHEHDRGDAERAAHGPLRCGYGSE
jgi:hypothetical protein